MEILFWSCKAKDPVCGMAVVRKKAAETFDYHGKTYYFCTPRCKATFARRPKRLLNRERVSTKGTNMACH